MEEQNEKKTLFYITVPDCTRFCDIRLEQDEEADLQKQKPHNRCMFFESEEVAKELLLHIKQCIFDLYESTKGVEGTHCPEWVNVEWKDACECKKRKPRYKTHIEDLSAEYQNTLLSLNTQKGYILWAIEQNPRQFADIEHNCIVARTLDDIMRCTSIDGEQYELMEKLTLYCLLKDIYEYKFEINAGKKELRADEYISVLELAIAFISEHIDFKAPTQFMDFLQENDEKDAQRVATDLFRALCWEQHGRSDIGVPAEIRARCAEVKSKHKEMLSCQMDESEGQQFSNKVLYDIKKLIEHFDCVLFES